MNDITAIAAVVVAIWATMTGILRVLEYFHVESADVIKFFTERGRNLAWNIYLVAAFIMSLMAAYVLVLIPILLSLTIEAATIEILMLWSLLGIWLPAIRRLRKATINKAVDVAYFSLVVLALVGFWISQWPAWQTPTLLSSLLAVLLVYYLIDRFIVRRRRKVINDKRR